MNKRLANTQITPSIVLVAEMSGTGPGLDNMADRTVTDPVTFSISHLNTTVRPT